MKHMSSDSPLEKKGKLTHGNDELLPSAHGKNELIPSNTPWQTNPWLSIKSIHVGDQAMRVSKYDPGIGLVGFSCEETPKHGNVKSESKTSC